MNTQTEQQLEFISMVANRLAQRFMESLFVLHNKKNYATHIGRLEEILDWAGEFYEQYHDKIINWDTFKRSSDNIYNAANLDDLIVAFGRDRIKKFYTQNANLATFFREKYSANQL